MAMKKMKMMTEDEHAEKCVAPVLIVERNGQSRCHTCGQEVYTPFLTVVGELFGEKDPKRV